MATTTVSILIERPAADVWSELEAVESHVEWMADADSCRFETEQRRGVGTVLIVETKVGPFRTTDVIEFTTWQAPRVMGVAHRGLFTGAGTFTLVPEGTSTRMEWSEHLRFPWFLGGPLGAIVARPILKAIWRGNLRRLKTRIEAGDVPTTPRTMAP